jgi:hypothetical protein
MEDQPTCGKGLAENSILPGKLGELTASMAENLEIHMKALDLKDENAKKEHAAYLKLAKEYRKIAAQLQATGEDMAGYRDLPMGRHDQKAMASPKVVEAFENFVRVEQELLTLLQERLGQDQQMLVVMDRAGGSRN